MLPHYYLYITIESYNKQMWQHNQTQYRTNKFFEGICIACCQIFHSNSSPEHHLVVSTMTAGGFLNGCTGSLESESASTGPVISLKS